MGETRQSKWLNVAKIEKKLDQLFNILYNASRHQEHTAMDHTGDICGLSLWLCFSDPIRRLQNVRITVTS